ncbi:hypothetical protein HDR63_03340 [bacterium]|nr:hypothetical protein [bacterium]
MRNKIKFLMYGAPLMAILGGGAHAATFDEMDDVIVADEYVVTDDTPSMDDRAADAIAAYDVSGTLFQQITDLEQQKVLMQLEKERAQLDLELDRLAAEKIRLHMEIDTLSGQVEAQQKELETERARLETEAARLAAEKAALEARAAEAAAAPRVTAQETVAVVEEVEEPITDRYRLVNVIGAGAQLQATIEDLSNGQNKRIAVGKVVDGYTIQSISLDDGVAFVRDGVVQHLNIGNGN